MRRLAWCCRWMMVLAAGCGWLGLFVGKAAAADATGQPGAAQQSPAGGAQASSARAAQESPELEQLRREFIQNFQRISINTAPGDAQFLQLMVQISGAKRGVEVGTATGYGAMHMGLGFERTGGKLITIEIDPQMAAAARKNLAAMKLDQVVTVVEGDALKVLPELEGRFDFVFLDAVKRDYLKYFRAIEPKLEPGAVILADNVIKFAEQMRDFLDAMEQDPDYQILILRTSELKGDGMALIHKLR